MKVFDCKQQVYKPARTLMDESSRCVLGACDGVVAAEQDAGEGAVTTHCRSVSVRFCRRSSKLSEECSHCDKSWRNYVSIISRVQFLQPLEAGAAVVWLSRYGGSHGTPRDRDL